MGFKERRHRQREEFRAEILAAALDLFSREGYAGFSMRKLAARIEHSPTTIYLYFRDKDDLLFHICENYYVALLRDLGRIRGEGATPEQTLRAILLNYIHSGLANPELYKVVFFSNPQVYGRPEEYASRDTMSLRCWTATCEVINECIADGTLRQVDGDTLAIVFWSAVHGLVSSLIFTKDFPMPNPDVMADMLLSGLLRGYRP